MEAIFAQFSVTAEAWVETLLEIAEVLSVEAIRKQVCHQGLFGLFDGWWDQVLLSFYRFCQSQLEKLSPLSLCHPGYQRQNCSPDCRPNWIHTGKQILFGVVFSSVFHHEVVTANCRLYNLLSSAGTKLKFSPASNRSAKM